MNQKDVKDKDEKKTTSDTRRVKYKNAHYSRRQ